ncbi:toxin [Streptomyces sp. NPDC004549]|uniref:toxin n=1 Tax=unclassified Streptomyces TaxID=2593676 RepID=UPI0018F45AEC|nr:toxin [Streptomyces sp. DSM 110735]MBJ7902948.1 toxin [Streptomyces sp. DSM 110735]
MSRAMKSLLAGLVAEASRTLTPPAEPRVVMGAFCAAMSKRRGRPIDLVFRAFPEDVPASGLRLDCGDRSIVVVEERTPPESQLVILGHELWHEEQGEHGHRAVGALDPARATEAVRRTAARILAAREVPRETLPAVAARAGSTDRHEQDAETFGLLFGRELRTWIPGRYARGPVNSATLEGRIRLSLLNRGGQLPR